MSTHSRITDDGMKYFQFKARQCFLLQKENHEWNEFCKQKKCTCCSCQPTNSPKETKNIGVQASSKAPIYLNRSSNFNTFQNKELPKSLNDIKTKLEKIDLRLSSIKVDDPQDNTIPLNPKINIDSLGTESIENESAMNFYTEQKKLLIRKSLLNSLQRLHSFAMQVSPRPISTPTVAKKSRSFYIPHDLQKQRIIARKAYLASLVNHPKIEMKKETKPANVKKKTFHKKDVRKQGNLHTKTSIKKESSVTKKTVETLIQSEETSETKDENIEKSVDNILDDLLNEEILVLNAIRQKKLKNPCAKPNLENIPTEKCKSDKPENMVKEVNLHKLSPESRDKIMQNPFFKSIMPIKRNIERLSDKQEQPQEEIDANGNQYKEAKGIQNTSKCGDAGNLKSPNHRKIENKNKSISKKCTVIYTDPQLAKKISNHRNLYWQYLEKISRTRANNFDPWILTNMVAESLLDDCLSDISQELCDMPSSLVTDLYNEEFTPLM